MKKTFFISMLCFGIITSTAAAAVAIPYFAETSPASVTRAFNVLNFRYIMMGEPQRTEEGQYIAYNKTRDCSLLIIPNIRGDGTFSAIEFTGVDIFPETEQIDIARSMVWAAYGYPKSFSSVSDYENYLREIAGKITNASDLLIYDGIETFYIGPRKVSIEYKRSNGYITMLLYLHS